jgi:hypothetical protein
MLLARQREDDGMIREARQNGGFRVDFQPISLEEMQRLMQFLLQQQARFAADLAIGQERFDAFIQTLSVKTDRITDRVLG